MISTPISREAGDGDRVSSLPIANWRLIGWTALLGFMVAGPLRLGAPLAAEISEAAVGLVFLICLIRRGRWTRTSLDIPIAIWTVLGAAWCGIGVWRQSALPSPYQNVLYGGTSSGPYFVLTAQLALCAAYYLAVWSARDDSQDSSGAALAIAGAMLLAICALDAFRHISPDGRIEAGFTNANLLGAFLALLIPTIIAPVIGGSGGRARTLARILLACGLAAALILTHSRGAQASLLAAIFVFGLAWARPHGIWLRARTFALIFAAVSGLLGGLFLASAGHGVGDPLNHSVSDAQRRVAWRAGYLIFVKHPLTGVGLGGFPAAMLELGLREPNPETPSGLPPIPADHVHSHNLVLQAAAERGICGLALLLGAAWLIGSRMLSVLASGLRATIPLGAAAALSAWAAGSMVDYTAWFPAVAILLGLQTGRLMAHDKGHEGIERPIYE